MAEATRSTGTSPPCGERALLTAGEVAAMIGMSTEWVWEASRRGEIPTVTLGRYRRYRREAVHEWLRESEAGGSRSLSRA